MVKPCSLLMAILAIFCWIANSELVLYKDPTQPINRRLKDLMTRMTLEEKIGQMVQIERSVASAQVVSQYFMGNMLSTAGSSVPAPKAKPEAWVDKVNEFQMGSLSTRLGIPMIYGIDGGHMNVYNATIFPHNIGLGATRDSQLIKRIGAAIALEIRALGIPYNLEPCIAVCRDPRWGTCYQSYSEDPGIVRSMTEIITRLQGELPSNSQKGLPNLARQQNVIACAKHFVGDGGTSKGINGNNTVASRHELLSIHMPAYYDSIIKGVSSIMVSYSSWNGLKMHANRNLITGLNIPMPHGGCQIVDGGNPQLDLTDSGTGDEAQS